MRLVLDSPPSHYQSCYRALAELGNERSAIESQCEEKYKTVASQIPIYVVNPLFLYVFAVR